jgi:type IV secretory pathway VirB3-like protein
MRVSQVHTSLNRRKAVMGVPALIFGIEALMATLMLGGGLYVFMLAIIPVHFAARWMHTRDDGSFSAMFNFQAEKDVYDPWARPVTTAKRPAGYGRDLQC